MATADAESTDAVAALSSAWLPAILDESSAVYAGVLSSHAKRLIGSTCLSAACGAPTPVPHPVTITELEPTIGASALDVSDTGRIVGRSGGRGVVFEDAGAKAINNRGIVVGRHSRNGRAIRISLESALTETK